MPQKTILILGANSDVAKQAIIQYVNQGHSVIAASRSTDALNEFIRSESIESSVEVLYFDAVDFSSHQAFYDGLLQKPNIVLYAAGYLVDNLLHLQNLSPNAETLFEMQNNSVKCKNNQ